MPALATFNWISWIKPDASTLNNIVGSNNGLGLNPLPTFDWNVVVTQGDPLVLPAFAIINQFGGMCIAFIMLVISVYNQSYTNLGSGSSPFTSPTPGTRDTYLLTAIEHLTEPESDSTCPWLSMIGVFSTNRLIKITQWLTWLLGILPSTSGSSLSTLRVSPSIPARHRH
jgi:hypothetical protein